MIGNLLIVWGSATVLLPLVIAPVLGALAARVSPSDRARSALRYGLAPLGPLMGLVCTLAGVSEVMLATALCSGMGHGVLRGIVALAGAVLMPVAVTGALYAFNSAYMAVARHRTA